VGDLETFETIATFDFFSKDIKNRFNASLRKYNNFEEYMEANDKKREKSKKKYYWR
jgi:hypothetical protein